MHKWPVYVFASLPFITLVLAIPWANRVEPMIWGMPFLLWWIVVNVLLTSVWLRLAFYFEQKVARQTAARNEVSS